jgi:citrate lyase subunit beta/citryl-CoA lyase
MRVDWEKQPLRTFLFVPGTEREKIGKLDRFAPDIGVIDLEDAVATSEKAAARVLVREVLEEGLVQAPVFVRINALSTGLGEADIAAVVTHGLAGIQLPMVETSDDLRAADFLIGAAERAAGLEQGSVRLLIRFETAAALSGCAQTLREAPPRVLTGGVGLGDLAKDLGVDFDPSSPLALHARVTFALAVRAAGLRRPIDGAYPRLDDLDGLEADSRLSRSLGYQGRLAVHPRQVDTINAAYGSLSDIERQTAQRIVEAFEQAEAEGRASIDVDGQLVDYPIYDRAKAKLAEER